MSSKVQVFVSSTMKDLANERDAVVRKISAFNFEPVNAESWLPDGSKIWARIHKEILSSHLFVLIVGERYDHPDDQLRSSLRVGLRAGQDRASSPLRRRRRIGSKR